MSESVRSGPFEGVFCPRPPPPLLRHLSLSLSLCTRDLFSNAHGLVSCWENGGYSDDLIASATCQAKKLKIVCNPSNVLQQRLPRFTTIGAYWNYTCRQVFVLDTYVSAWHKTLNRGLIAIHVYLSAFFVAAVASNCFR